MVTLVEPRGFVFVFVDIDGCCYAVNWAGCENKVASGIQSSNKSKAVEEEG